MLLEFCVHGHFYQLNDQLANSINIYHPHTLNYNNKYAMLPFSHKNNSAKQCKLTLHSTTTNTISI